MKKLMFLIVLFVALVLSSCSVVNTGEDGYVDSEEGELSIEIASSQQGFFVEPGQTITYTVEEILKDEGQVLNTKSVDDYDVKISNEDIATVNDDNSVKVSDDALSGEELEIEVEYGSYRQVNSYTVRKDLTKTIDSLGIVTDPDDYDVVVNKNRSLDSDYVPSDLVSLSVPTVLANQEINQLRKEAADALTKLFSDAEEQGFRLLARSGYRSYATQKALFERNVAVKGREHAEKYSAMPGKSEHQTGLSIDITSQTVNYQLYESFGEIPEGKWVKENAHKYGFIVRYPKGKEDVVGYGYEPWHLRYVGVKLAEILYDSGLTMEEFFEQ